MPLLQNIAGSTFQRMITLVEKALSATDGTGQEKIAVLNEIARTEFN
ncbi:hypothetical protein [Microvirga sp. G4-2]